MEAIECGCPPQNLCEGEIMKRHMLRHEVEQPLDQSYRIVPLTLGQNALVSAEDFDWISKYNWCAQYSRKRNCYIAVRYEGERTILMHCEILRTENDVDHWNHNTLDNRRENLREATRSQNLANKPKPTNNTSGFKGAYFCPARWQSSIGVNGRQKHLGTFPPTEQGRIAAARAYDRAAIRYFGEFAHLNFPRSDYT
jgi:HNH endonuclease